MRLFECGHCGQLLYFENVSCEHCGARLGFRDDLMVLEALGEVPGHAGLWQSLGSGGGELFRLCANAAHDACNWLVPDASQEIFCRACRHNRTIPDLSIPDRVVLWQRIEGAKRRLIYGLLRFGLPLIDKRSDAVTGLAFDFLADPDPGAYLDESSREVMTGHARGVITINIAEADDAEREKRRRLFAEPYRTLLGHFRHEAGHYYWERLIRDSGRLDGFRALFGDERRDYGLAMQAYYRDGGVADWNGRFVSPYASSHPWEDWAECWAHYMHLVDTLETAHHFGLRVRPRTARPGQTTMAALFDPYEERDFAALLDNWLPLVHAVNSLNRSMGQPDLYPFVVPAPVIEKLHYIHALVREVASGERSGEARTGIAS